MQKRSSMTIRKAAARIAAETDGLSLEGKDPAAVALGRRGGLKGGKARAAKLSAQQRKDIATKAALVRWTTRNHE